MKKNVSLLIVSVLLLALCSPVSAHASQVTAQSDGYTYNNNTYRFTFSGSIYADRAGAIQYRWARSDNANPPIRTLNAPSPGWYSVESASWSQGSRWSGTTFSIRLEVLHPNTISSEAVSFTVP
jgi:hypothetical protein